MALAVVLGFFGMLRTAELVTLRWGQVMLDLDAEVCILNLGYIKSSQRKGAQECVRVTHRELVWALAADQPSPPAPGQALCPCSATTFRSHVAQAVVDVGLHGLDVRP